MDFTSQKRKFPFIQKFTNLVRKLWAIRFFRFLVVGGVNTLFYYTVFALLILLHLHYVLAVALAVILGTLFNFKIQGVFVFRNRKNSLILRFGASALLVFALNTGFLKIFSNYSINTLIAQAILTLPMAVISFLLMSKFVFNKKDEKNRVSNNQ
jgi:putative flippase GtrA